MRLLLPILFALFPLTLLAQEGAPPPNHVIQKALTWMQSKDPEKRKAAFRSVHLLDENALPAFESALHKAQRFHEKQLGELLSSRNGTKNPIREAAKLYLELQSERERVDQLIRVDYHKDPGKIRMLNNEMETLTKSHTHLARFAKEDPKPIAQEVDAIAHALADISAELTRFNEPELDPEEEALEDRKQTALLESYEGELYLSNRKHFQTLQTELAELTRIESDNADLPWPAVHHTEFATHLNHQRVVLGLPPLKLQDKLSQAAAGHSQDMKNLGFFAHESPVKGKRTPSMRAKKAAYQGGFRGENIAMGYANPRAAYQGWFGSDGHRFIMFAKNPNECGLGRAGAHWTFMTGKLH